MLGMKEYPDNYFDLAIVDPPYGIGKDWGKRGKGRKFKDTSYDNASIPGKEYFEEVFRVSKEQVIWGYNYFTEHLGPTNYLLVWDKCSGHNPVLKYSKGELAFLSKRIPFSFVKIPWDGYRMGKEAGTKKIHPHQKPIELYSWLLDKFAKAGNNILDTHVGSASSLIACAKCKVPINAVGFELDPEYYEAALNRIKKETAQESLFQIKSNKEFIIGD
jgi:site-specific DNA-methyltransferase (adenine-specific)